MMNQKKQLKNKIKKGKGKLSRWSVIGIGKEKDVFVENLAMLFSSGVDVYYALESLKNESKSRGMKMVIGFIQEEISDGSPIWKAFEDSNFFPSHIISLVKIGEESGRLPENLQVIASQQQKERVFRSKIRSAMMYPVFVLVLAAFIGLGISWFILPKLATVFSQMKIDLPMMTKILISTGAFMGEFGVIIVPLILFAILFIVYFTFFFSKTKFIGQAILLKIPGVGRLIREVEIGRFGYLLGTLLQAGVPLLNSLESIENASTTRAYKKLYKFLKEKVSEGNSFQKGFFLYKKSEKIIPSYIQNMLFAAERSGNVPKTLIRIGNIFEEKTDTTTKNLAVILEPILLVIVWLGVVFIALAVILPIYNLIGGFNSGNSVGSRPTSRPAPIEEVYVPEDEGENVLEGDGDELEVNIDQETINKVLILETGIGFLNVRDLPSIKGKILIKIRPGEEYDYISGKEGWYEIKISEEITGWISSNYAEKIEN